MVISEKTLETAKTTCLIPAIVQSDTVLAQVMFDFSLIVSMCCSLFFTPFLSYLVHIQTQNFMMNQTTNTRFSKHRKENASEAAIAQLAEYDDMSDVSENDEYGASPLENQRGGALTHRTRSSRVSSLDGPINSGCASNCGNMFCSAGHFRKQERIMKKFVRDPNVTVNQEGSSGSDLRISAEGGRHPASVSRHMQDSYAKR